jgi:nitrite reductase/ring-hydroxylating ferredoxin subunit
MLATMEENPAKDFIIMIRLNAILICFLLIISCDEEYQGGQIPIADFPDIVLNLNLPEYRDLNLDKRSIYVDGGLRGLIIYRENDASYIAFETTCSFQPSDACANVKVHSSTLYMTDTCCGSIFNFPDGQPTGGPARLRLRKYETFLVDNTLTITDTPIF